MNPFMLLLGMRRAKSVLCYAAILAIAASIAIVLPAMAEHCLILPNSKTLDESNTCDPAIPTSYTPPKMFSYYALEPSSSNLRSTKRAVLVPGCSTAPAAAEAKNVLSPQSHSLDEALFHSLPASEVRVSVDSISPILKGFCEYEISQTLVKSGTQDGATSCEKLPAAIAALYPPKEIIAPHRFADQGLANSVFLETATKLQPANLGTAGLSPAPAFSEKNMYSSRYIVAGWYVVELFSATAMAKEDSFTGTRSVVLTRIGGSSPIEISLSYLVKAKRNHPPYR